MPASASPGVFDANHLDRQTMGDPVLRADVLSMFRHQLQEARETLVTLAPAQLAARIHALKGAARGLGAFALAQCAERLEAAPAERDLLAALIAAVDDCMAELDRMTG